MDLGRTALAVHDLIPVAVAAGGLGLVSAAVGNVIPAARRAALIGTALAVLGGLSKAIGKLIGAMADRPPPQLLDEALFPLLAPGMVLLASAVVARRSGGWAQPIVRAPLLVPITLWAVAGALAAFAGAPAAKVVLIGVATIGNVTLGIALIRWSRDLGLRRATWLYATNLIIVVGLAGMARALEQTTAAEWLEQNVNLVGQLAFLFASRSLLQSVSDRQSNARPQERV